VVKKLCAIKETPIATPDLLALASGERVACAGVMGTALVLSEDLEREAERAGTIRLRLIDLPAAPRSGRRPCALLL
jgi:hypothetical protein